MKNKEVCMTIGMLYLNGIDCSTILKCESLLVQICKSKKINLDLDKYIKEYAEFKNLCKYSNIMEYIKDVFFRYVPSIKDIEFNDLNFLLSNSSFNNYIGIYDINVGMFNYLNESVWPLILEIYTGIKREEYEKQINLKITLIFKFDEIEKVYGELNSQVLVEKLCSDVSLYLTYNKLGKLDLETIPSIFNKEIHLPMQMFIY